MATINMHMKFEIEIPKETWLMLRKPCRLQTDGQTDGRMDKVNPVYPPPTSLGGGIMKYIWGPTVLASKYTYMSPNGRSIKSNKIFNNPNGNKTFVVCNGSDYKTIYQGCGTRQQ